EAAWMSPSSRSPLSQATKQLLCPVRCGRIIQVVEPEMLHLPFIDEKLKSALRPVLGDEPVDDDLVGEQAIDFERTASIECEVRSGITRSGQGIGLEAGEGQGFVGLAGQPAQNGGSVGRLHLLDGAQSQNACALVVAVRVLGRQERENG